MKLHNLPDRPQDGPADGPVLCSHDVLFGVWSGVVSEILNMFNIPDTTPDPDPDADIECSHDGTDGPPDGIVVWTPHYDPTQLNSTSFGHFWSLAILPKLSSWVESYRKFDHTKRRESCSRDLVWRTHGTETTTNIKRRLPTYQVCASYNVASALLMSVDCAEDWKRINKSKMSFPDKHGLMRSLNLTQSQSS